MNSTKIDPLYTIFEQQLFNFHDENEDRTVFVDSVVSQYLVHIRKLGLSIPKEWESQVLEELSFQVSTMLAKKIYGCLSINEYRVKKSA